MIRIFFVDHVSARPAADEAPGLILSSFEAARQAIDRGAIDGRALRPVEIALLRDLVARRMVERDLDVLLANDAVFKVFDGKRPGP